MTTSSKLPDGYVSYANPEFGRMLTLSELAMAEAPQPALQDLSALSRDALKERILAHTRWRYHHGFVELRDRGDTYTAYCRRIDSMKHMISDGMQALGESFNGRTIADLAASEGFFADFALENGASSADCYELSDLQLERLNLIRAWRGHSTMSAYKMDFQKPFWASAFGKTYDTVFCLGIVYHLENPFLFLRNLAAVTERLLVLESDTPNGGGKLHDRQSGGFALVRDQVTLQPGNVLTILELRPDRDSLVAMLFASGFREVIALPPSKAIRDPYFESGAKSMLIALK